MALQNSLYERLGGAQFPFEAADVSDTDLTFEPLDPGKQVLVDVLKAAINYELGPAWTKVTNSLGSTHYLYGTTPVQGTYKHEPNEQVLTQVKKQFPLLAIHRVGKATHSYLSTEKRVREQEWNIHYILGPLADGAWEKLEDVLVGIDSIVDLVVRRRGHTAYSSALVFGNEDAYFTRVELVESQFGVASLGEDGTKFYAMLMTLKTRERSSDVEGRDEPFLGGTITVGVGNATEIRPEFVVGDTDYPPQ